MKEVSSRSELLDPLMGRLPRHRRPEVASQAINGLEVFKGPERNVPRLS